MAKEDAAREHITRARVQGDQNFAAQKLMRRLRITFRTLFPLYVFVARTF